MAKYRIKRDGDRTVVVATQPPPMPEIGNAVPLLRHYFLTIPAEISDAQLAAMMGAAGAEVQAEIANSSG